MDRIAFTAVSGWIDCQSDSVRDKAHPVVPRADLWLASGFNCPQCQDEQRSTERLQGPHAVVLKGVVFDLGQSQEFHDEGGIYIPNRPL